MERKPREDARRFWWKQPKNPENEVLGRAVTKKFESEAALAALLVAGCASLPPPADRERVRNFAVLKPASPCAPERPAGTVQQASGHLSWSGDREADRILLASPFWPGLAKSSSTAPVRLQNQRRLPLRQTADADALLAEATGYRPRGTARLASRPRRADGQIDRDFAGRPV